MTLTFGAFWNLLESSMDGAIFSSENNHTTSLHRQRKNKQKNIEYQLSMPKLIFSLPVLWTGGFSMLEIRLFIYLFIYFLVYICEVVWLFAELEIAPSMEDSRRFQKAPKVKGTGSDSGYKVECTGQNLNQVINITVLYY